MNKHDPATAPLRHRAIADLHRQGWERRDIAELFGIAPRKVQETLSKAGISRRGDQDEQIPGEEWSPLPGWPFVVSSFGRVRGRAGLFLTPHGKPGHRRRIFLTRKREDGTKERISVDLGAVVWCAFGHGDDLKLHPRIANGDLDDIRLSNLRPPERDRRQVDDFPWTEEDDDALRRAPTRRLAISRSRHSKHHTLQRIRLLALRWPAHGSRPPELKNPERYKAALYRECRRLAPAYLSPADKEDVAGSAFLAIMERRATSPAEAVELARKAQGRMFNRWRDVSVDAPIPGTDGLTHLDRLSREDGLHMP